MAIDGQAEHAAYIFSPDASYELVSRLRHSGLPSGVHLVASVTGPWPIVAIAEFDDLTELPAIVESLFGGKGGGSVDPPTAYARGPNQVKSGVYADEMAFVRMTIRGVDEDGLSDLLGQVQEAIGSDEVNAVFGDFDVFACVVGDEVSDVMTRIFQLRAIDAIVSTMTLWIIDYVSAADDAPREYRRRSGTR